MEFYTIVSIIGAVILGILLVVGILTQSPWKPQKK